MRYRVIVTRLARAQIAAEGRWWREHRSGSLLEDELTAAFALLAAHPEAGSLDPQRPGTRKLLLRRVQFYLYYLVDYARRTVRVRAFWHTARGSEPTL